MLGQVEPGDLEYTVTEEHTSSPTLHVHGSDSFDSMELPAGATVARGGNTQCEFSVGSLAVGLI